MAILLSPPPFPLPAPHSSLESTQTATPAYHKWPYLALVPTAPWFDVPLLNGLSLKSPKSLEIVKWSTISYCCNDNAITAWSEVEDQLFYLIKVLLKYKFPFYDEEKPTFPYKYRYKCWHKNSTEALKAAQQSHLTFCILMGYVRFCMVAWDNTYHVIDPKGNDFKWWWELDLAKQDVPHNIIDLVHNSELNCFNAMFSSIQSAPIVDYIIPPYILAHLRYHSFSGRFTTHSLRCEYYQFHSLLFFTYFTYSHI